MTETCVLSAGFLFYSHPPNSNNIYFLLGMDDYNGKWSDFGGRRNDGESEIDCAVREMIEETLNVIQFEEGVHVNDTDENDNDFISNDISPKKVEIELKKTNTANLYDEYAENVKRMITKKDYTYRIGVNITLKQERETSFDNRRTFDNRHKYNPQLLSVSSASSFSHFVPCKNKSFIRRLRVCYVKYIPWQPNLPSLFSERYAQLYHLKKLSSLSDKIDYFKSLPRNMQSHPAILVERNENEISNITVLNEWMEKQQIAWWSIHRIKNAIKNGGRFKKNVLRYGFLSTLSVVVEYMTKHSKQYTTRSKSLLSVDSKLNPFFDESDRYTKIIYSPNYFQIKI
jgi:hypothetical protein